MRTKKWVVIIGLSVFVAGAAVTYYAYSMFFSPNTAFEEDTVFVYVPTGADYEQVRDSLRQKVKHLENFDFVARQKGYTDHVKPGRYQLKKGMNNNEIVSVIRSQNLPVKLTFNNQERLENLAGRVAQQIEADSILLLAAMQDVVFLSEKGFTEETALAMYIPNTYEFYWNSPATSFPERMYKEYTAFWNEDRMQKAKNLGLTTMEVMSLAAIVQKETAMVSERKRVAGVYLNRLQRGMLLQADPTVIFALKKNSGDFDQVIKRVLFRDLDIDSPYNTYKYPGIPPGPIAMPDISSIDAVLNPEKHDYLYFVADVDKPGYHVFAKTLAQHNANAAKYHRWVAKQGY